LAAADVKLIQFLDGEKEDLLQQVDHMKGVYKTLSESLKTLLVLLRSSFAPDVNLEASVQPETRSISISKARLQSSAGEAESNYVWLIAILNNIAAINNTCLSYPRSMVWADLQRVREVHRDILRFLENLFAPENGALLPAAVKQAALPRQKRRDIEMLLAEQVDPFFAVWDQIARDEYNARLRPAIREQVRNLEIYQTAPDSYDALIKERCAAVGLAYEPELVLAVIADLAKSEEIFAGDIRRNYTPLPEGAPPQAASRRRHYMNIVARYLARAHELAKMGPILETIYCLFQPRPTVGERLQAFFARLLGREPRPTRKDISYSYIIGGESIRRQEGSLEQVMAELERLQKYLLRMKNQLGAAGGKKNTLAGLEGIMENCHRGLRRVYEDSFGLIQWLGKKSNQESLSKLPKGLQQELNQHLYTLNATLIINSERLRELNEKYPRPALERLTGIR
jgi:hypothetical protein